MALSENITHSTALVADAPGTPLDVLTLRQIALELPLKPHQVLLKILRANINPSDLGMVRGTYGDKMQFPCVFGMECACQVICLGADVSNVEVGNLVIPLEMSAGAWQTHKVVDATSLYRVKVDVSANTVAQLCVNPLTAVQMLDDFEQLRAGDYVIQNGATSAVAIYVMQLCRLRGVHTVNVFRARDSAAGNDRVRHCLTSEYGATHAITDVELAEFVRANPHIRCRLGLTCLTGTEHVAGLTAAMARQSTVVVYGSMDKQGTFNVTTDDMISKSMSYRGYWLQNWYAERMKMGRMAEIHAEFDRVLKMFHTGDLRLNPVREFALTDWRSAFQSSYFKGTSTADKSSSTEDPLTYKALLKMD